MDRRRFLSTMSVAGATAALGYTGLGGLRAGPAAVSAPAAAPSISTAPATTTTTTTAARGSRVLVVVQMNGGNDGLNTLVPADGRYRDARPTIAVPPADLLSLGGVSDSYGLHPALAPMLNHWNDGQVAAIASVGYEGSSRSHFAAMDDWASGMPGVVSTTGWLGRWLDATGPGTTDADPWRAVALGGRAEAMSSQLSPTTTIGNPNQFALQDRRGFDAEAFDGALRQLGGSTGAAMAAALDSAEVFADLVADVADAAGEDSPIGGRNPSVTELLSVAAGLIELDLGTQVVVVSANGFDTHANQLASHGELLADIAGGIASFLNLIDHLGRGDDVLVMTTSEFGRRVAENGSGGTDHGRAGVQFLAGAPVAGGLVGGWDLGSLVDGDLTPTIDMRSLFQLALDWLGGPTSEVLGGRFDDLGVLRV